MGYGAASRTEFGAAITAVAPEPGRVPTAADWDEAHSARAAGKAKDATARRVGMGRKRRRANRSAAPARSCHDRSLEGTAASRCIP